MSAPKLVESIPAVTAPVKLPRIVPARVSRWAVAATVLLLVASGLLVVGIMVTL